MFPCIWEVGIVNFLVCGGLFVFVTCILFSSEIRGSPDLVSIDLLFDVQSNPWAVPRPERTGGCCAEHALPPCSSVFTRHYSLRSGSSPWGMGADWTSTSRNQGRLQFRQCGSLRCISVLRLLNTMHRALYKTMNHEVCVCRAFGLFY